MLTRALLHDPEARAWLDFRRPSQVLLAYQPEDVLPALVEAERRVEADGLYAVGFVAFAAAAGLDPSLVARPSADLPRVCLGLFGQPERLPRPGPRGPVPRIEWQPSEGPDEYVEKIQEIRRQIALGNTYQINYTLRLGGVFSLDPWDLFANVAGDAPYGAYLECGHLAIVSASPELFFRRDGRSIACRPMKGTARRGLTLQTDLALRDGLLESAKCRAENIMITDMVRNDLGRIAEPGSVRATTLLSAEKYATVWQLTSTVTAETDVPTSEVMRALFPCASVTGAPKVSSMALIARLEGTPRGIYTGALGYLRPGRRAQFNVAIRTAVLDRSTGVATYGVGGGIVWDSDAQEEYAECLLKARVVRGEAVDRDFRLLETMRWTPEEGVVLREEHLARLADSARYFDFDFDRARIEEDLDRELRGLSPAAQRVRLLLAASGRIEVTASPFEAQPAAPVRVKLAAGPVRADDPFLYHKTTRRDVYDAARASVSDCDDVLLWNEDGFITETTIANVAVDLGGRLCTPPEDCGLLPGTLRRTLLDAGELELRRIRVDELSVGDEIALFNSVRGVYRGVLTG